MQKPHPPLTPKQVDALAAFEYGETDVARFHMKGQQMMKPTLDGVDITSRMRTLRKRGYIKHDRARHVFTVTDAGREELRKHGEL